MLPNKLAVLGISHPRLTAAKKHNACGAQDDQAGEQGQHAEADKLPMGDEHPRGVDCLLQGDLEQVSLRWSEKLVKGVSRERVVLWSQCKHPVVQRLAANWLGLGLRSVLQRTCGACKPFLANAPEGSIRLTNACAPVGAGPASTGREACGVITSKTSEAVRTDACKGQAMVCTVASVEAWVRLAAVDAYFTEVTRKSRGT